MKYFRLLLAVAVLTVLVTSCASHPVKKVKMPPLNGMIYDKDNKPVSDAEISIDGTYSASSDVYGHFTIIGLRSNDAHKVVITKKEFEKSELDLIYSDPTQVLYVHMYSSAQLISEAENYIQAQDWQNAGTYLLRAEIAGGDPSAIGYLKAVLAFKKGEYSAAVIILKELLAQAKKQPYICLFLADIFQYHLADSNSAREYLQKFLESRYDPDVEARVKTLENDYEDPERDALLEK